jgi:hypothetical protein
VILQLVLSYVPWFSLYVSLAHLFIYTTSLYRSAWQEQSLLDCCLLLERFSTCNWWLKVPKHLQAYLKCVSFPVRTLLLLLSHKYWPFYKYVCFYETSINPIINVDHSVLFLFYTLINVFLLNLSSQYSSNTKGYSRKLNPYKTLTSKRPKKSGQLKFAKGPIFGGLYLFE